VLLIEDDRELARTVQEALRVANVSLDHAAALVDARRRISTRTYDAIILDLGLPDGSGLELAEAMRQSGSEIPILMLTAQTAVQQRLDGFAHGADDYVCKPFAVNELIARLKALLRRAHPERQHVLRYGDVELDLLKRVACRGDVAAVLSDREAALLAYLMRHPEEPLSREQLAQEVWGLDAETDSGVVNVYINYLRNKLEHGNRQNRLIHTVRGVGYMLAEVAPE
jgi:two-component system response regulator MprA